MQLSEQEQIRRDALTELNKLDINAFPPEEIHVNAFASEVLKKYPQDNHLQISHFINRRKISANTMGIAV